MAEIEQDQLKHELERLRAEIAHLEQQLAHSDSREGLDGQTEVLAEVEHQREFLQQLINSATIAMAVVHGPDHVFELVNPAYLALVGAQERPLIGLPLAQALPQSIAAGEKWLLNAVYQNGKIVSAREYESQVDGRESYWDIDHIPLRNHGAQVLRVLIVAREVTEDVRARRTIALSTNMERSAQTLRTLIDILPAGVIVSDAAGHIIMENEYSRRLTEGPATGDAYQPRGRYELRYLNGQPFPVTELPLPRALQQGEMSENIEILFRFEDGKEMILNAAGSPVRDEHGELVGAVSVTQDITGRKAAEAERESLLQRVDHERRLLEGTIQQIPGAIVIAEAPSGKAILVNEKLREYLMQPFVAESVEQYGGYQALRLDGTPLEAEDWPLARAIQHGETTTNELVTLVRKDTSRLVLSISAAPVHDPEGNIIAGVASMYEVDPTTFTPRY